VLQHLLLQPRRHVESVDQHGLTARRVVPETMQEDITRLRQTIWVVDMRFQRPATHAEAIGVLDRANVGDAAPIGLADRPDQVGQTPHAVRLYREPAHQGNAEGCEIIKEPQ